MRAEPNYEDYMHGRGRRGLRLASPSQHLPLCNFSKKRKRRPRPHIPSDPSRPSHISYRLKTTRKRAREMDMIFTISRIDIERLLTESNGCCALSGMPFCPQYNFSIDRIDSSKGYVVDNIQLVTLPINLAKHTMSNEDFLLMCKHVTEFTQAGG